MSCPTAQTSRLSTSAAACTLTYSRWQLVRYFLRLGTLGFGGPVALVKYIRSATQWTNEPGLRGRL